MDETNKVNSPFLSPSELIQGDTFGDNTRSSKELQEFGTFQRAFTHCLSFMRSRLSTELDKMELEVAQTYKLYKQRGF